MTDYQERAKQLVVDYYNEQVERTYGFCISEKQVYVVWFAKTLQNWKALLSTTVPDGMYYELTHDGDKKVTYIDAYKKCANVAVSDLDPIDSDEALRILREKLSGRGPTVVNINDAGVIPRDVPGIGPLVA